MVKSPNLVLSLRHNLSEVRKGSCYFHPCGGAFVPACVIIWLSLNIGFRVYHLCSESNIPNSAAEKRQICLSFHNNKEKVGSCTYLTLVCLWT